MLEQRLHLVDRSLIRDAAKEPGIDLLTATIVEVRRTLRRKDDAQSRSTCPLEQILQWFLRWWLHSACRHEYVGLIDHEHHAQLGARRLCGVAAQTGNQVRHPRLDSIRVA